MPRSAPNYPDYGTENWFFGDRYSNRVVISSDSTPGIVYVVAHDSEISSVVCSCPSGQLRGYCKHIERHKNGEYAGAGR